MNVKIILKNVASYKEEATLNTDKKINLVYGLNGTGKTVLSNYLYSKSKKKDMSNFQNCQDDFGNDEKIIVYNENFIADNFLEKIPGIFTLSSENKNVAEQIEQAEQELNELNNKKDQNQREIESTENNFKQKKEDAKNEIWKIKEKHTGGDRPLDYCFIGLKGDKEKLFKHMIETQKSENKPQESIE